MGLAVEVLLESLLLVLGQGFYKGTVVAVVLLGVLASVGLEIGALFVFLSTLPALAHAGVMMHELLQLAALAVALFRLGCFGSDVHVLESLAELLSEPFDLFFSFVFVFLHNVHWSILARVHLALATT